MKPPISDALLLEYLLWLEGSGPRTWPQTEVDFPQQKVWRINTYLSTLWDGWDDQCRHEAMHGKLPQRWKPYVIQCILKQLQRKASS